MSKCKPVGSIRFTTTFLIKKTRDATKLPLSEIFNSRALEHIKIPGSDEHALIKRGEQYHCNTYADKQQPGNPHFKSNVNKMNNLWDQLDDGMVKRGDNPEWDSFFNILLNEQMGKSLKDFSSSGAKNHAQRRSIPFEEIEAMMPRYLGRHRSFRPTKKMVSVKKPLSVHRSKRFMLSDVFGPRGSIDPVTFDDYGDQLLQQYYYEY